MYNNNVLSVTKSYLEHFGVNMSDWNQVQSAIYLLGGHPYNIEINKDALVRIQDCPYMCHKDDLFTTTLRGNRLFNIQKEYEILDVSQKQIPSEQQLMCNSLEYTENYQENARMKQQTQAWIQSTIKPKTRAKHRKHSSGSNAYHGVTAKG